MSKTILLARFLCHICVLAMLRKLICRHDGIVAEMYTGDDEAVINVSS